MISCAKSGNQRLLEIECHAHSILRSHRPLAPCARLDIVEATGAEESPDRSALVRGARPAPHNPPAADPPSLGSSGVQRRIRRERVGIALAYLAALRGDFESLVRMARVIALLSPEVVATREFERLRLIAKFVWRYQMT